MNTHGIELPEHDCLYETTNESGFIDVEPAYRKSTVLRLIEADRKRRGEPVSVPKHLIERLRKHCENKDNTAFARSTMREALQYLTAESDRGEPVKVPSSFPARTKYSVKPHGNGYAIYQGRDQFHHGLNLAHLTECTPEFSKRIESALNAMSEPVSKTDWNSELSSWSDEDFIRVFHERPDLAKRLRKMLAEPVKVPSVEVEGEEILICTLDGYQYFLGPEYDGELEWANAKKWCESLGEGYELPNRLVMLAICMNEATATLLTEYSCYWTSSEVEDDASHAWHQHWYSSAPGLQSYANKSNVYRIRAVRRRRIEENK